MSERLVVRLNATTFPMIASERDILARAEARVVEIEGDTQEAIVTAAADAEAVMVVSAYVRGPTVDALRRCRVISRLGTGTDKIDIAAASRRGIPVAFVPDFCTEEVADHAMALLLAAARQIKAYEEAMRQGRQRHDVLHMHRLSTQTAGIVGLGRIGRAVARRAAAFGLRLLACDPQASDASAGAAGATLVPLGRLLAESDYVILTCPLTDATRRMIGRTQLAAMKRSAVLVNVARGEIVDESELAEALRTGLIRYASLDVFEGIPVFAPEGFATTHPLFGLPNVLMTPHVAAYSEEGIVDCFTRGARAVAEALAGEAPSKVVNPEVRPWYMAGQNGPL